jgi:hypothetical protein
MTNRILRVLFLLLWLELGLMLILVPWSDFWQANYFMIHFPDLAVFLRSAYLRGAVSGLGVMNVFLALEAFRQRAVTVARRS